MKQTIEERIHQVARSIYVTALNHLKGDSYGARMVIFKRER